MYVLFLWQKFGVVPDIVIVGENIGNGFPFSVVATRADISDKLPDFITTVTLFFTVTCLLVILDRIGVVI